MRMYNYNLTRYTDTVIEGSFTPLNDGKIVVEGGNIVYWKSIYDMGDEGFLEFQQVRIVSCYSGTNTINTDGVMLIPLGSVMVGYDMLHFFETIQKDVPFGAVDPFDEKDRILPTGYGFSDG